MNCLLNKDRMERLSNHDMQNVKLRNVGDVICCRTIISSLIIDTLDVNSFTRFRFSLDCTE